MPYFRSLTSEVVAEIKKYGISIYPWTIDEPGDFESLQQLSVDGILTNRPDRLKAFLEDKITGFIDQ